MEGGEERLSPGAAGVELSDSATVLIKGRFNFSERVEYENEGLQTRRNGEILKLDRTEKSTKILREKNLRKVCLKAARERNIMFEMLRI